jgi:hypothetical protein
MDAEKFSFKFSRQTQKNLVGSSKYAYFRYAFDQLFPVGYYCSAVSKFALDLGRLAPA